jgi:demethylmenaquinone methyltransferase/2-methoxy-6-polyprenyl-1,4-benzoquinol methylase
MISERSFTVDLFNLAAPIFDQAMRISGHHKALVELADRVKNAETEKKNKNNQEKITLLDLGGGTGELVKYLPDNFSVTIADPSPAMLKKARNKKYSNKVEHVLADGAALPFADEQFDYITISDALHHFRDVSSALAEARRVLKKGGRLFILEFDPAAFLTKIIIFFEKIAGEPVNFFNPSTLSKMIGNQSFKTEHEYLNKAIYIMSIKKIS